LDDRQDAVGARGVEQPPDGVPDRRRRGAGRGRDRRDLVRAAAHASRTAAARAWMDRAWASSGASIIDPSYVKAPFWPFAASSTPAAHVICASVGANDVRTTGTCLGWIDTFASKPLSTASSASS